MEMGFPWRDYGHAYVDRWVEPTQHLYLSLRQLYPDSPGTRETPLPGVATRILPSA
jgi:hypothetical protein